MRTIVIAATFSLLCLRGYSNQQPSWETGNNDIPGNNITFLLYTRQNLNNAVPLVIGDKNKLLASGFKGTLPTKMCTHGYLDNGNTGFIKRIKEEILKVEEANFIILDWSACSKNVFYEQVVLCMKTAGRHVGYLLKFLQKEGNLDLSNVHLIGHSLGAHLFGFVFQSYQDKKAIGRITALDPAGPLFEYADPSQRLNENSAKFVDVIHTCRIFTGMNRPIGTVDFYPNGGYGQPGCSNFDLACNHRSSHRYYIETINNRYKYLGRKCNTLKEAINGICNGPLGVMGYYSNRTAPGMYFLKITK